MRLFVAVNFTPDVIDHLVDVQALLQTRAEAGNFLPRDNIHLTIVFLGEVESTRIHLIKEAMRRISIPSFSILLTEIGSFKTAEGRLYWLGIKKNDQLETMHQELVDGLIKAGFRLDDREYKPHITLAREVVLPEDCDLQKWNEAIQPRRVDVEKIALMRSDRVNGEVVYREVASRHLP
jgi:RNA 2',3'-cyclic 3'-phosphodiesterase